MTTKKRVRVMNPKSRVVSSINQTSLGTESYRGYVLAPWDCVCAEGQSCHCDKRVFEPSPDRLAEAEATLAALKAGIESAREKLQGAAEPKPKKGKG